MFILHTRVKFLLRSLLHETYYFESVIEHSPSGSLNKMFNLRRGRTTAGLDLQKKKRRSGRCSTYLVEPGQLVRSGIRPDVALEVDVRALFDVLRIQSGAHLQTGDRRDCN